jgi:Tripartite tricarboxylate transporter family receptor
MPDLIAGQIDLMFGEGTTALPHVRSGRIKAFGVMAKARWFAAPDVPTMDELEAPGLYISFWHGLWVVKGTPNPIIARLNAAIVVKPWRIPRCGSSSPTWARKFLRATNRLPTSSARCRRPKQRNGGRSSRRRASRRNEFKHSDVKSWSQLGHAKPSRQRRKAHYLSYLGSKNGFQPVFWSRGKNTFSESESLPGGWVAGVE